MINTEGLTPELYRQIEPIQMRLYDIDVLGHVNNSIYNLYYDLGKTAYFNSLPGTRNWKKLDIVIAHIDLSFIVPIHFPEKIAVATRIESIGEKSFVFDQMLFNMETKQVKSVCKTVMVCIDREAEKAVPMSEEWRELLCKHEGITLNDNNNTHTLK